MKKIILMEKVKNEKLDELDIGNLSTIRHYAEKHKLSKETVRQRIKKGTLPYVLIDGIYFIKENL